MTLGSEALRRVDVQSALLNVSFGRLPQVAPADLDISFLGQLRSAPLALTKGLLDVLLSHPCPHCGHKQEKKGSWFKTIGHYTCPSCGHSVQMSYDEKIRLFEANAHRAIE